MNFKIIMMVMVIFIFSINIVFAENSTETLYDSTDFESNSSFVEQNNTFEHIQNIIDETNNSDI